MFVTYPDRDYLSGCAVPRGSPPDLRPPRSLPARRPRHELRSARRRVVRPGPAGHAAASGRGCAARSAVPRAQQFRT